MLKIKPSLSDLFQSSIRAVLKNKSRTLLTSLGIIIGVTSVILLTSIGNGLTIYINQQFESLGSNSIFISPGKIFNDKGGFSGGESSRFVTTKFSIADVNNIKRNIRGITVLPTAATIIEIKSNKITKDNITLAGSTNQLGELLNLLPSVGNGRWFTLEEYNKGSPVLVMGYTIANDLFPGGNPLNRTVIIKGKNYKIIGIVDKKGSSFGGPDQDSQVYTPLNVVFNINGNEDLAQIMIKTSSKDLVEPTKSELNKLLLKKYDKDAFTVFDSSQLLSSINSIIATLTIALTGIAAISLVVGGIGIMNIMLVTVSERTREIGLRKAIGAFPNAILIQFLFEAMILSGIGGIIGIILGSLGTSAINNFFPAKVTMGSVTLAFGVSFLVGIIFGVAPARKASKLSPIEALRYE
ncbi:MAG: ABC-type transport system, involved in lipoprotein release, permease component [Candidatus Shapirobacteria bacterium GW2011_GWE1_38_10]|uniref:ABC-type transport system, involved in lipoprotein release, permease component n=1 Tax=Candidatus Shapirobacteria bacterium GW2011_GWE1_38_10 TaxID=1618488 RepID=A0A0G0IHI4_9BACT|nr:MAG: ABC-type transport system, involved in lipoprotein release, permease component [Candidatus Shapirobacteria bacterium GW2011_GWF2_37_20]KKQ50480.1 MAG: ABC-type transport system, involved in lipoprotein release, permease component [Candidatus Shapirobacteria bacterium GW2011_GWE1_38_10]KKQ65137.1 MAG: ABC-type transport system, involved in lipoprotein release, permease component [Candidatus Shapirobacteria bacterium GW2011_GWF1_38_23]HBP50928.1 ABC transporter permease [Candidatus Shapiro